MSKEAKLGLFVVTVVVVFLFFTINMGTIFFAKGERRLDIYFTDIGTLEVGAPVKQAGYDVGEVIGFEPKKVQTPSPTIYIVVTVALNDDAVISDDSKASIQTMGMMGEKYIEITFGSGLDGEDTVEFIYGQGPYELDRVLQDAVGLTQDVQVTVQSFNEIFANDQFQQDITQLIANMEEFSNGLNRLMGVEEERLKNIMNNLEVASANLRGMIASSELFITDLRTLVKQTREPIVQTLSNTAVISQDIRENLIVDVKEMTKDLRDFSKTLKGTSDRANQIMAKMEGVIDASKPKFNQTMQNFMELTETGKSAVKKVDDILNAVQTRKGVAHKVIYDEKVAETAESTLQTTSNMVNEVSMIPERLSLITDLRYFPDEPRFDSDDNLLRADLSLQYDINEKMYLLAGGNNLGASNDFELQFGYKWKQLVFHGGLIESEVGAGVDWHIFPDWMVGIEGIGLTSDDEERLDAYTEYRLWNQLYLVGGVQDITDEFFPNTGIKYRF